MRCINVVQLSPKDGERHFTKHYNMLFDLLGLDKNEKVYWGIAHCHDKLSSGTNLSSYGVPIEGEVIIRVIELDGSKPSRWNVHDYYDWSDYLFFNNDNDEINMNVSLDLLRNYRHKSDVEQVIFHDDAIKIMKCYKTDNCVELWRKLHKKYIVDKEPFEQREEESIRCYIASWKTTP